MLRIELLIDARAELGEGPLWDVEEQCLYWIDLGIRGVPEPRFAG
jgi:sugar lactone lactonase YvrE